LLVRAISRLVRPAPAFAAPFSSRRIPRPTTALDGEAAGTAAHRAVGEPPTGHGPQSAGPRPLSWISGEQCRTRRAQGHGRGGALAELHNVLGRVTYRGRAHIRCAWTRDRCRDLTRRKIVGRRPNLVARGWPALGTHDRTRSRAPVAASAGGRVSRGPPICRGGLSAPKSFAVPRVERNAVGIWAIAATRASDASWLRRSRLASQRSLELVHPPCASPGSTRRRRGQAVRPGSPLEGWAPLDSRRPAGRFVIPSCSWKTAVRIASPRSTRRTLHVAGSIAASFAELGFDHTLYEVVPHLLVLVRCDVARPFP
jgi:hypothetical protein